MDNKYKLAALAATFALLTGCSSSNISQPTSALVGNVESSVKANIAVGDKIEGQATANVLFGVITWGQGDNFVDGVDYGSGGAMSFADMTSTVKSAAAYNAVKASGADLIVAPRYVINTKSYGIFKTIHVTVNGYKGTIASVK